MRLVQKSMAQNQQEPTDYTKMTEMQVVSDIKTRRDHRLAAVVVEHLPAWIIHEQINTTTHLCTFDLVFRPAGDWQQRRYTYDAEVDVLHYRGAEPFDEARLSELSKDMLYQPST